MRTLLPVLTIALLAGCSKPAEESKDMTATSSEPVMSAGDAAPPMPEAAAAAIPSALQGRWGLVPADCTSTAGDAKGLIEVGGNDVTFYESKATLGTIASSDDKSISAKFDFSGEGQTWSRDMVLSVGADGKTLVRSETGEDALPEPLTYTRCN
jgi:hypothetical protein